MQHLLASIADALLDGARGNSGAILAQFFQGMSDSAGELTRFSTYTFGKAVSLGSQYAHDALSNPREGTILSVMAAFAQALRTPAESDNEDDFRRLMEDALRRANTALLKTQGQLDVLRKAGVVDAGAKGFVALVSGMTEYIRHGRIAEEPDLSVLHGEEAPMLTVGSGQDSEFRYCTECLVKGVNIDRRKLREALSELGDSLVLAGTKRKAKIHIHVNDPETVFDTGRQYGDVSAEKADDMHRQLHLSHDATRKFAVVTDSVADITDEDMERLDIHMVPARIQFGSRGYLDKVSITTDEFFAELSSNPEHPTTSQPSPGDFRRQFQFLASHFSDVISINLTAAVSGTFAAAELAATRTNAHGQIHVINSCNASMGQGQLVVFAAECAKAGASAEKTVAAVEALLPQTQTFALLSDLRYAVRGGRLPAWVKTVADVLRFVPIIGVTTDGRVATASFMLGKRNRIARFVRHIARRVANDRALNIGIGHAICPDDAAELERHIRRQIPNIFKLTTTNLGAGLGAHGGPGTLLVSTQPHTEPLTD